MRDRLLASLVGAALTNPARSLRRAGLLTLLAACALPFMRIDTSHSGMVDPNNPEWRNYSDFQEKFGSPNQLVLLVQGGNEAHRRALVDALTAGLPGPEGDFGCDEDAAPKATGCVRDLVARIDLDALMGRALLFIPTDILRGTVEALLEREELDLKRVQGLRGVTDLIALLADLVESQEDPEALTEDGERTARELMDLLGKFLDELALRVKDPERAGLSFEQALFDRSGDRGVDSAGYLSSPDGRIKLAIVRPYLESDQPQHVLPMVAYVRAQVAAATEALGPCSGGCPDGPMKVSVTGLPALTADEATSMRRDLLVTGVLATLGIFAVLLWGLGSLAQSVLALIPLAFTLVWSLAFATLCFGGLNMLTAAVVPLLLGLCVDASVHLISRFEESRAEGLEVAVAVEAAVMKVGPGMLTGVLTTSGAFFALIATDFRAFREMGAITAFGLIVGLLLTMTLIPALLMQFEQLRRRRAARAPSSLPGRVVAARTPILLGGALLIAAAAWILKPIPWSYDYTELLPESAESAEAMYTLTRETEYSAEVAGLTAKDEAEARAFAAALAKVPEVAKVEAITSYVPTDQVARIALIQRLRPLVEALGGAAAPVPPTREALLSALDDLADGLQDAQFEAARAASPLKALLDAPLAGARALQKAVKGASPEEVARLGDFQRQLLDVRDRGIAQLRNHLDAEPVTALNLLPQLPAGMRERFHHQGSWAVYAYPSEPIGDLDYTTRLVKAVQAVSPTATGFPVTHYAFMKAIQMGFDQASLFALIAVFLLLLLDFRSLRYALLAAIPLGLGVLWAGALAGQLGLSYNAGNIITLPLMLGIAVDSGVHLLHRFRQQGEGQVDEVLRHTGRAVLVSGLTSLIGFGALSFASHRAMQSFGHTLMLGVGCCLVASCLVLPALLDALSPAGE